MTIFCLLEIIYREATYVVSRYGGVTYVLNKQALTGRLFWESFDAGVTEMYLLRSKSILTTVQLWRAAAPQSVSGTANITAICATKNFEIMYCFDC